MDKKNWLVIAVIAAAAVLLLIVGVLVRPGQQNVAEDMIIITVDGKEYTYNKVWIAPTMHGSCYGGGMIPTPGQDRSSGKLSVMLFHGAGRLRTLCVFPSIFKGEHIKHTKMVAVHTGREITVEFDRPTPLQIDGETIRDVTRYTARSSVCGVNKAKEKAL